MAVSTNAPPHNLGLVIDFVNTLSVETGEDQMGSPAHLARWLQDRGVCSADAPAPRAGDLEEALALREALRAVLHGHAHGGGDGAGGDALERVAQRGQLSVRFDPGGSVEIAPRATGYPGVLARLLVPAAYAALDGTWQRVKACDADDCLEAFYDRSRNRSGRWCDMAVCGNRTKVRAYRSKRTG